MNIKKPNGDLQRLRELASEMSFDRARTGILEETIERLTKELRETKKRLRELEKLCPLHKKGT